MREVEDGEGEKKDNGLKWSAVVCFCVDNSPVPGLLASFLPPPLSWDGFSYFGRVWAEVEEGLPE